MIVVDDKDIWKYFQIFIEGYLHFHDIDGKIDLIDWHNISFDFKYNQDGSMNFYRFELTKVVRS